MIGFLGRQELLIADGHHRYETALAYQAEVRADARFGNAPSGELAADWIMMMVVNGELSELVAALSNGTRLLTVTGPGGTGKTRLALQVAEGKTNKEVGAALFLSHKTVEFHLSRIYRKLDIHSRAELIRLYATEPGLAAVT